VVLPALVFLGVDRAGEHLGHVVRFALEDFLEADCDDLRPALQDGFEEVADVSVGLRPVALHVPGDAHDQQTLFDAELARLVQSCGLGFSAPVPGAHVFLEAAEVAEDFVLEVVLWVRPGYLRARAGR